MDNEMLIKEEIEEIMDISYVELDAKEENISSLLQVKKKENKSTKKKKDPLAPSEVPIEIKKNLKGQPVCKKQRMLIVNLFKSMLGNDEKRSVGAISQQISQQTGIGFRTIVSTWRAFEKTGEVKGPNTTRRRTSISQRLDDSIKDAIRNKIKWFNDNGEVITIARLLSAVNDDPELPRFSRGTFYRILQDNLKYTVSRKKNNHKTAANSKATNSIATSSKVTNSKASSSKAVTNSTATSGKAITNSTTTIGVTTKDITNSIKKKRTGPQKLDENFDKSIIRKKVHGFYLNGTLPTLSKILDVVNKDPELPNFTCVTLHSLLMNHLYFTSTRKRRDNILIETDELVLWRRGYLRKIKAYRAEGRPIYYLYQTSVYAEEVPITKDSWVDNSFPSRLVISHVCSETGFVTGGLFCFEYRKNAKDDNGEMYGETFQKWFESFLPTLSDNCVIVMDNALYQAMQAKRIPNEFWKKNAIIQWLTDKGISLEPDFLKVELLRLISDSSKETYERHLNEPEKGNKKTIIRVPPHHSELNPVERLWFIMKQYIKTQDSAFSLSGIKHFVYEDVERIIGTEWASFIRLVRQEEEKLWIVDEVVDKLTDGVPVAPILMDDDENTTAVESASDLELTDDFDFDLLF